VIKCWTGYIYWAVANHYHVFQINSQVTRVSRVWILIASSNRLPYHFDFYILINNIISLYTPYILVSNWQEIKLGDADVIRSLFERAISLSLPPKKMKVCVICNWWTPFCINVLVFPFMLVLIHVCFLIWICSFYSRNIWSMRSLMVMKNRSSLWNRRPWNMFRIPWPDDTDSCFQPQFQFQPNMHWVQFIGLGVFQRCYRIRGLVLLLFWWGEKGTGYMQLIGSNSGQWCRWGHANTIYHSAIFPLHNRVAGGSADGHWCPDWLLMKGVSL